MQELSILMLHWEEDQFMNCKAYPTDLLNSYEDCDFKFLMDFCQTDLKNCSKKMKFSFQYILLVISVR